MSIQFFEKTVEKGLVPGINRRKQGFYQAVKSHIFAIFVLRKSTVFCTLHTTFILFVRFVYF